MKSILGLDRPDEGLIDDTSMGGKPRKRCDPRYSELPCTAAMAQDKWDCPYMPRQRGTYCHTQHSRHSFVYNAAASRPVPKSEIRAAGRDGAPQKAMDLEWARLDRQGCFDYTEVFESWELTDQA